MRLEKPFSNEVTGYIPKVTKRLFFGIRPAPEILRELLARQQVFRESNCLKIHENHCRWISRDAIHMTLHFLGSIDPLQETLMRQSLAVMPWTPRCTQRLDHVVAFPSKTGATTAGLGGLNGPLEALTMRMRPALLSAGLTLDDRRFYPHVTLVRFQTPIPLVEPLPVFPLLDWMVDRVALFQSHPTASGSRYEILEEFPLAPVS